MQETRGTINLVAWIQENTIGFVALGVTLSICLVVLNRFVAQNETGDAGALAAIESINVMSGFLPLLALIVVAAILIMLVMRFTGSGGRRAPL